MKCPKCGIDISPTDLICANCGHDLMDEPPVPPQMEPPLPEMDLEPLSEDGLLPPLPPVPEVDSGVVEYDDDDDDGEGWEERGASVDSNEDDIEYDDPDNNPDDDDNDGFGDQWLDDSERESSGEEEEDQGIEYDDDDGTEQDEEDFIDYDDPDEDQEEDETVEYDMDEIMEGLYLGKTTSTNIVLPVEVLKRHLIALGASGSGKTVFGKCIIEETTRQGVPTIIVDPQGDLASLGLIADEEICVSHNIPVEVLTDFREKAEVRIFTPASSKGIPLSLNPLKKLPDGISPEEAIRVLDTIAGSLVSLLGYKSDSDDGKAVASFLYHLLETSWMKDEPLESFPVLAEVVNNPRNIGIEDSGTIIKKNNRLKLAQKIRHLSLGMEKLFFNFGVRLTMDILLEPVEPGKVPVNVIYLNTLASEEHKQFYVAVIGNELYNWMISNPSDDVQVMFYIDEVGPYLPPHPFKPPAKDILKLLFKQGRKYGVSCMMCTQNPADVDYKAMAQANTWGLGRMMTPQDLSKVKGMLKAISTEEAEDILDRLPVLKAGEFILICPDVYDKAQEMKVRWLVTKHKTLEEEYLEGAMVPKVKQYFEKKTKKMVKFSKKPRVKEEKREVDSQEPPVKEKTDADIDPHMPTPQEKVKCPKCAKTYPSGTKFCTACGSKISQLPKKKTGQKPTINCPKCGKVLKRGAKFCISCGYKIPQRGPKGGKGVVKKPPAKKQLFCPKCGNKIMAGTKFCPKCGNVMKKK